MAISRTSLEWNTIQFNRFIQNFINESKAGTGVVLKKFMFDLLTRIVVRTPVDKGRARAGWSAAGDALGIKIPPPRRGSGPSRDGEYEEKLEGTHMFIRATNNVEYILPLEFGWSKQAPYGMVRISMAELRGEDLNTELMDFYARQWGSMGGQQRYRSQRNVLRQVFAELKNQPAPTRRPKP